MDVHRCDDETIESQKAMVFGNRNIVHGVGSAVTGDDNTVTGNGSSVDGNNNIVTGDGTSVTGDTNVVTGSDATVSGEDNTVVEWPGIKAPNRLNVLNIEALRKCLKEYERTRDMHRRREVQRVSSFTFGTGLFSELENRVEKNTEVINERIDTHVLPRKPYEGGSLYDVLMRQRAQLTARRESESDEQLAALLASLEWEKLNRDKIAGSASASASAPPQTLHTTLESMKKRDRPLDDDEGERGCVVCFERIRCVVLSDCGHVTTCVTCTLTLMKGEALVCPVCRVDVDGASFVRV